MSLLRNFGTSVKITCLAAQATADTGAITTTGIDNQGYDGIVFLTRVVTPSTDNILHLEGCDTTSSGSYVDLTGTAVISNNGSANEDIWIELVKPKNRYNRMVIDRPTTSAVGTIYALQYGAGSLPVDNTVAGTIDGEIHFSPTTGTV